MVYEVQNILHNITNSQRKRYIKKVKKYIKKWVNTGIMTGIHYWLAKMGNRMTDEKIHPNIIPWTFQELYHGTTGEQIMMDKKTIKVLPYRKIGKLTYYSDTLRIDNKYVLLSCSIIEIYLIPYQNQRPHKC